MGIGFFIVVVYGDDFQITLVILVDCAQCESSDAAEAIDTTFVVIGFLLLCSDSSIRFLSNIFVVHNVITCFTWSLFCPRSSAFRCASVSETAASWPPALSRIFDAALFRHPGNQFGDLIRRHCPDDSSLSGFRAAHFVMPG